MKTRYKAKHKLIPKFGIAKKVLVSSVLAVLLVLLIVKSSSISKIPAVSDYQPASSLSQVHVVNNYPYDEKVNRLPPLKARRKRHSSRVVLHPKYYRLHKSGIVIRPQASVRPAVTVASTQAQQAIDFAYAQLGCPYVYGGIGPCSSGFDCSGLTMEAWASAGVAIPRTSYEQWSGLTPVSGNPQPGDIMIFDGGGHVAIYVGNGYLIDAPQPGMSVEKIPWSGWYQTFYVGAVRP